MTNKPLIQYLSLTVDRAQNGGSLDGLKRKADKALRHYAPMQERVEELLRRANSATSLHYATACLIEAQSVLICHDLDSQTINGTFAGYGLTTVAVGDSLATATRTCYQDLLREVESLDRYDESYGYIEEDSNGGYLRREDVIRLLGGGV